MNVAILGGLAGKRSNWLSGYSYRKSFTYSRASGAVENYQVKLAVYESDPADFVSNGGFDSNTTGWTGWGCALASVSGGQSGNCLQMTRITESTQVAHQSVTLVVGGVYRLSCYVKSGTSGNEEATLDIRDDSTGTVYAVDSTTTSSEWQQLSVDFVAPVSGCRIALRKATDTAGTMLFDTVTLTALSSCNAHCLSTFNDLRFTDSGGNELDYWIESISGTTPNQVATVWVELDSIGTSSTTFYMYYGKADASAASNGANTFILFDDFERGSNEDAVGGDWTVVYTDMIISTEQKHGGTRSCKLARDSDAARGYVSHIAASGTYAIEMMLWKPDSDQFYPFLHGDGSNRVLLRIDTSENIHSSYGSADTGANWTKDSWHKIGVQNLDFAGKTYDLTIDGVVVVEDITMDVSVNADDQIMVMSGSDAGDYGYIDNFIVRNWRSTEPALGSWGSEESA